jgi:hypothetical protein
MELIAVPNNHSRNGNHPVGLSAISYHKDRTYGRSHRLLDYVLQPSQVRQLG